MKYWVKTREIEEKPLFRHDNRLFRHFLQNIGNCYQLHFMWKIKKYKEKDQWKCAKTAISGILPVFSAEENISSKIGLGHVLSIPNMHLCAKNQYKLMMKSRQNAKNQFFGIFPAFSAGKVGQLKIGLCHILGIAILQQCTQFQYRYKSRNTRNTVFPAKIGCSGDF